jgi:hypothetical protein
MKKSIRNVILFFLFTIVFAASLIYASASEMIGISNITNGESKSGSFEMAGVILNDGRVSRVAVKTGIGPWEDAGGVERFRYQMNTRHIVLSSESVFDPGSGQYVETPIYGPYYGNLNIVIGAFDAGGTKVAEKTVNVTIVPEKPYSDIPSGTYSEPLNILLKAAPEVAIYYTTDGSDPKTNGISYTGAILVSQNTVIKAVSKSANDQYSEIAIFDLKINSSNPPGFLIQYYEDQAFSRPLPEPVSLKAGTYYLKIISDRKFSSGPFIDIDAPGSINDIYHSNLLLVSDCVYQYTRIVNDNSAATGDTQETIKISGTDNRGNPIQNVTPINLTNKAAYLDTQPPSPGSIMLAGGASSTNDPTPCFQINSNGASQMRLALSETGLASALWVEYAAQYDEFDISIGGNGNKTIWIEFKDQAGNIQTQHASITICYDNAILSFDIEYFHDSGLTQSLGNNPYLKEGTYYLKITANQDLSYNPSVQIDAEGSNNDLLSGLTTMINPRIFYYTRTIVADSAAVGVIKEQVTVQGELPSNINSKAAYTDTQAPDAPVVTGPAATEDLKPAWTWNSVTGATRYRYSFSDGSNWVETTTTSFTPVENLVPGNNYTLYVQAGDKAGNWSPSGSFTIAVLANTEINIKQGITGIPNGTGSFNYGDVSVFSNCKATFTIENTGNGNLSLTGDPIVRISGAGASSFNVIVQPSSPVTAGGNTTFEVAFTPVGIGTKTATVSITNNDTDENPYTFTVTGTGIINGTIPLDTWTPGNITAAGEVYTYCLNTVPGKIYTINWDDIFQGTGTYTGDIKVSAYRQDLAAIYFSNIDSGFSTPQVITAQDNVIYLKIAGYSTSSTGSFAVKVSEIPPEPVIGLTQGTVDIPNGGSYNFGNVALPSRSDISFVIHNTGGKELSLTGNPKVLISGADASNFSVTLQPVSKVPFFGGTLFTVRFTPASAGIKTATVSIANNDDDNNPYTFTITGTGTGVVESLTLGSWTTGNITTPGEVKIYSLNTVTGGTYSITWDDSAEGSGVYTGNVQVFAYHQDYSATYFSYYNSGYLTPKIISPVQDNVVYIKVTGYLSSSTGSFGLKASLIEPVINVKQDTTIISNGGSYDFGNVALYSSKAATFTVENTGMGNLCFTDTPKVRISGAGAANFNVTAQPASPIAPNYSTTFTISFTPTDTESKTATVSIANNDPDMDPYTFTVTGNGVVEGTLTPGSWIQGNIAAVDEAKTYCLNTTPGLSYAVAWDEKWSGSYTYTGDVKVSAYRGDGTVYFNNIDSGYSTPQVIAALDNIVYIKVAGYSSSYTGSFALKAFLSGPVMEVSSNDGVLPNGTGSYNYGNVALCSYRNVYFTIKNPGGTGNLNLTGTPKVNITGVDASCFSVTTQPSSPVTPNSSTNFAVKFTPDGIGIRTATVSITGNDNYNNPYTFTISGTGVVEGALTLDTWSTGNISDYNDVKTYSLNTIPGQSYAITWDDSGEGTGTYTGDVRIFAYRKDLTTAYFSYYNSGYQTPRVFTAQDDIAYIRVESYSSSTGSFAVKASLLEPVLHVKEGTTEILNGGNYDFGNVLVLFNNDGTLFTVQNTGAGPLNFTDTPRVKISGPDAADFSVAIQPSSGLNPGSSTFFDILFAPTSSGTKTATVSIANNDLDQNPFTFTVTGTGIAEELALDAWTPGAITYECEFKTYWFKTTPGQVYAISWNDKYEGTGVYRSNVVLSAYRKDLTTPYFRDIDSGYLTPQIITAQDDVVYIQVRGGTYYSPTPNFALKASLHESGINIKQGTTDIPNGTGSYNYGDASFLTSKTAVFTIRNTGTNDLRLTDSPRIQISGTDAACFSVTAEPDSLIPIYGSTTFTVKFTPDGAGPKTSTVSIANNDNDLNPYTFNVSGIGLLESLSSNTWTTGNIAAAGEVKTYSFKTIPGKPYAITWDDSYQGSGAYTGNIKVSAYREDFSATYFTDIDSGYNDLKIITALDTTIYLKVTGNSSSSTGTFALKGYIYEPAIKVKQGTIDIPNGTGSYDFGNVQLLNNKAVTFTIQNDGTCYLNLTNNPSVKISGADASYFTVYSQPFPLVDPNGSTTFTIYFAPGVTGTKTATVSITNNAPGMNPYTFTITATGVIETLSLDTWFQGEFTYPYDEKVFSFKTIPGKAYAVLWYDQLNTFTDYTCRIKVSAYRSYPGNSYFQWATASSYYSYAIQSFTAQSDIVYIIAEPDALSGYNTGTYELKITEYDPVIGIKQDTTDIPNETGSYDFSAIPLTSSRSATFTIQNNGIAPLNLTGSPRVLISGADAASFRVKTSPYSPIQPYQTSNFTVEFFPTSSGKKTATVTVANNDPGMTPYTFTLTGAGIMEEAIPLDAWTEGTFTAPGQVKIYSFDAIPGNTYAITWDDCVRGSGTYTADVSVSAYRKDLTTTYFDDIYTTYSSPRIITAQDNVVYLRVEVYATAPTGSFALKAYECRPKMLVKQGTDNILNGTGSYNFGSVSNTASFTIQNLGNGYLNLSDTPKVRISGTDAGSFTVAADPASPVAPNGSATFSVKFSPASNGNKTATVSIASNDTGNNPYTFTLSGTGVIETLSPDTWTSGSLTAPGEEKIYLFNVIPGKSYSIAWDDSNQGSGTYTGNIKVSAYRQDLSAVYFSNADSGYTVPQVITPLDNLVCIKVYGYTSTVTGSFGLKAYQNKPKLTVNQGTNPIPNGTGSYDFGSASGSATFTIQNTGTGPLNLTDNPKVRINGIDASCFSVATLPSSPVSPGSSTTFTVKFSPVGAGTKTATVSIVSDDDNSPYTFTITGTSLLETLTPGVWTSGNISVAGEEKTYILNAIPGKTYAIAWDDSYQGSGVYNCDVKVSAYRQDLSTTYFINIDSGYSSPQSIIAQESIVYIKVAGYYTSSSGSFALKVTASDPIIGVKQGTTSIPAGTGNYNFGDVAQSSSSSVTFTITNAGVGPLNLTGSPKIQLSGVDAACFSVTTQPSSPVAVNGSTTFTIRFAPTNTGTKTATVSIASNDTNSNPYTFTITGTGTTLGEELTFGSWIPKSISTAGEIRTYYFSAIPGKTYTIAWDDSYQGSKTYTCDVKVSAYRQDLIATYFSNVDSGYASPMTITAQDSIVYIKVAGYTSSYTGSFGLRIVQVN